jgi:hypothetical protein
MIMNDRLLTVGTFKSRVHITSMFISRKLLVISRTLSVIPRMLPVFFLITMRSHRQELVPRFIVQNH